MTTINKNKLNEDYKKSNDIIRLAEEILFKVAQDNVNMVYNFYKNPFQEIGKVKIIFTNYLDELIHDFIRTADNYPNIKDFIKYNNPLITIFFDNIGKDKIYFRSPNYINLIYTYTTYQYIHAMIFDWFSKNHEFLDVIDKKIHMSDDIAANILYNIFINSEFSIYKDLIHELKHATDYYYYGGKEGLHKRAIDFKNKKKEFYEKTYPFLLKTGMDKDEIISKYSPESQNFTTYSNQYHEIWARALETLPTIKKMVDTQKYKSFNDVLKDLPQLFYAYDELSDDDKKKLKKVIYIFYDNYKNKKMFENARINEIITEEIQNLLEVELKYKIRSDNGNLFDVFKNPPSIRNMSPEIRGISTPTYDFYVVDDTTQYKEILHDDIMEYLIKYEKIPSTTWYDGSVNGYYGWVKMANTNTLHPSITMKLNSAMDKKFFEQYVDELNEKHPYLKFLKV